MLEDFLQRKIKAIPTLILYSDDVELGRRTAIIGTVEQIIEWAEGLLASAGVAPPPPYVPDASFDCILVTEDGEELGMEQSDKEEVPEDAVVTPGLIDVVDHHMQTGQPLKIIYFGGKHPGLPRRITPLRYGERLGGNHIIAYCLRDEMEKTFRLDRMHLPCPPLEDGQNDYRVIAPLLHHPDMLDRMLHQIADLENVPMEKALAAHRKSGETFESFFEEYPYGGYVLELKLGLPHLILSLGFEANDAEYLHYHFSLEEVPKLTQDAATHDPVYKG